MRQALSGLCAPSMTREATRHRSFRRRMYRDRKREMVLRTGFLPQIEHPQMAIPRHASHNIRMVRRELRAVDTAMHR